MEVLCDVGGEVVTILKNDKMKNPNNPISKQMFNQFVFKGFKRVLHRAAAIMRERERERERRVPPSALSAMLPA
jgi:hypothetical protein